MERQGSSETKEITQKQADLLSELLDSDELESAERKVFGGILRTRVKSSRDASALISHILGLLQFRRQFGNA